MMRHTLKVLTCLTAFLILSSAQPARADGFISPWIGANFAQEIGDGRTAFGFTGGGMGGGVFGGEFDFGYSPSFFGTDNVFGSNNVMTVMGNLILGIPFGGQRGGGVRPYGSGGVGLIRSSAEGISGTVTDVSDNSFGWNLGGGVMGYFGDHFGVRGDLRFFRTIGLDDLLKAHFGGEVNEIDFWRASFGVVFR